MTSKAIRITKIQKLRIFVNINENRSTYWFASPISSMKQLRKRRMATSQQQHQSILPLVGSDSRNSSAFTGASRRRNKAHHGGCRRICLLSLFSVGLLAGGTFLFVSTRSSGINLFGRFFAEKLEADTTASSGEKMTCSDGRTTGYRNDNYCDCLDDGADEPHTSACSHILVQQYSFICADDAHRIHASRVGDGVLDCPDGSDERG